MVRVIIETALGVMYEHDTFQRRLRSSRWELHALPSTQQEKVTHVYYCSHADTLQYMSATTQYFTSGVAPQRQTVHQRNRFAQSAESWLMAKPHQWGLWGIAHVALCRMTSAHTVHGTLTATWLRDEFMALCEVWVHGKLRGGGILSIAVWI